jgi:outer membrane receptor protein involved in Fe transport
MFAPNARYAGFGAFVQDEILAWEPTYLTLGLRYSYYDFAFDDVDGPGRISGDFDALTASVEAARDLGEGVRLAATLAQGFQAPNLDDLANDGDFAGGIEEANPDLEPADSLMAEVALEVTREAWSSAVAVFGTRIDDYIGRVLLDAGDPDVAGDETYMRANAGRAELWGVELVGRRRLGDATSPWSVEGVTSLVRGRQFDATLDPDGVDLRRVPPWNGRMGLVWSEAVERGAGLERAELSLGWAAKQRKLHPEDVSDPRIDPDGTPGWDVWGLDFSGPLTPHVRWNLALVNLLDEDYRVHGSAIDGAGRSLMVGISASF